MAVNFILNTIHSSYIVIFSHAPPSSWRSLVIRRSGHPRSRCCCRPPGPPQSPVIPDQCPLLDHRCWETTARRKHIKDPPWKIGIKANEEMMFKATQLCSLRLQLDSKGWKTTAKLDNTLQFWISVLLDHTRQRKRITGLL